MVVPPKVFRVPRVREYESFQVLELVRAVVDGSAHAVRTFPGGAQDSRPLYFGVLEHPSKDEAPVGELSQLDLGIVVLLDLPLLCSKAGECVCPLLVYEV